jgi:hypothetical protein
MENRTWTTFYGQQIGIDKLSHQHLSNAIHYYNYVLNCKVSPLITIEIENRFGGIILPYKPMISFVEEIKALMLKGYTDGQLNSDIIVDGKWVGKIEYN